MSFDPRTYLRDVINPLRDQPGGLPGDLAQHYAVRPGMTSAEIKEQLKLVRSFWTQRQGGAGGAATVCALMLSRDEELQRRHPGRMTEPDWWRDREAESHEAAMAGAERFADDLRTAFGALGQVTRERLDEVARHYPALNAQAVDEAVSRAGLRVVTVVDLPADSGLDGSAYRTLSTTLTRIGVPTVVQLVYPDAAPFRLLGASAPVLDTDAVVKQRELANTAADSNTTRLRKRAFGMLETALSRGADLRRLALFQIVDLLQAARRQHLPDSSLVRKATEAGLELAEAQTVVLSLPDEQPVDPADRIRQLIQDGEVHAARQALAALSGTNPDRAELTARVDQMLAGVAELRRRADEAIRDHREEEAEALLREAKRIAADDEDVDRMLTDVPPPPVRDLVARPVDEGVSLSWVPPMGGSEVRYRVVCGDTPPRTPGDGVLVAETAEQAVTDRDPVPARIRHYAVFATNGGVTWSRPVTASAQVTPPVTAVRVRVEPNEVFCSWRLHPAAEGVRVRRTIGRRPATVDEGEPLATDPDSLYDRLTESAEDRYYSIVAVYRDAQGAELAAAPVVAQAISRSDAPAHVETLRVRVTAVDADTAQATITWLTPAQGRVSVRYATTEPPWSLGARVNRADVEAWGDPVIGDRLAQGPETQVVSNVPSGRLVYVPFTFDTPDSAVAGAAVVLGVAEPVQQLKVRRTGGEAVVSWVWPPSVSLVEVTFAPEGGDETHRRMTRGQVQASGCRIPVGATGGTVSVRSVTRGQGGDLFSAPQQAVIDGVATVLEYHVPRARGLARGKRVLRVSVDELCTGVELHLVVSEGLAMPTDPDACRTIRRFTGLRLEPGAVLEEPFTVSGVQKPYWLRCFVTKPAGIRVVDPIAEMKVS